ncbi:hypothetical protein [Candidatus Enterovibrio escicola]|uniref:hypothetical protein n=1 Tax=Candidatus Enterovibrio escicola TaxID=1927127 RepID=UPI0012380349|nr:hypothetical protein [Candidatus Enterovibrio escacola]
MSLVKNDAKLLAREDEGLGVNTNSYLRKCISITAKPWKDAKADIDKMRKVELQSFVLATEGLYLFKVATITVRLTVKKYADLKLAAIEQDTTLTGLVENITTE